jgi:hypothetical protein
MILSLVLREGRVFFIIPFHGVGWTPRFRDTVTPTPEVTTPAGFHGLMKSFGVYYPGGFCSQSDFIFYSRYMYIYSNDDGVMA